MKILRIKKTNPETGELELVIALTEQQTQLLIDLALNYLVQRGLAVYVDEQLKEEANKPEEVVTLEEAMSDVMKQADPKDLPQA